MAWWNYYPRENDNDDIWRRLQMSAVYRPFVHHFSIGARRHGQEGTLAPPPLEMFQSVLCIRSYSKTLSRRIIHAFFLIFWGLCPKTLLGATFLDSAGGLVPSPLICPPMGKILRAPMHFSVCENNGLQVRVSFTRSSLHRFVHIGSIWAHISQNFCQGICFWSECVTLLECIHQ